MHKSLCVSLVPGNRRSRGGISAGAPHPTSTTWRPRKERSGRRPLLPSGRSRQLQQRPGLPCSPAPRHPRDPLLPKSVLSLHSLPGTPWLPHPSPHPLTYLCHLTLSFPVFQSGVPPVPPPRERLKKSKTRKDNNVENTDEKWYLNASERTRERVVWLTLLFLRWVGQIWG